MSELSFILDILSRGGVLGACAVVIWALFTEKLVPKSRLDEQRKERLEISEERRQERKEVAAEQRARAEEGHRIMAEGMARMTALEGQMSRLTEYLGEKLERLEDAVTSVERMRK